MTAKRMHDGGEPVGGVLLIGPGICPSQHGWGRPRRGSPSYWARDLPPPARLGGARRGSPSYWARHLPLPARVGRARRGSPSYWARDLPLPARVGKPSGESFFGPDPAPWSAEKGRIRASTILGGLIHEYELAA